MKVCVFGSGAFGGFIGVQGARAPAPTSASSPAGRIRRRCARTASPCGSTAPAGLGRKTSMLPDSGRGRPMEGDALAGVDQEMGRLVGVPTPAIDAALALIKRRAGEHASPGR